MITQEKYIVRVQLIRADNEGEYITGSFDYEVPPSTKPYENPLFLRAETFYKHIQASFRKWGKITITKTKELGG